MRNIRSTFEQNVFGRESKQQNNWYCFPAVVSNASRALGFGECTQDWITKQWAMARASDQSGCIPEMQAGPEIIYVLSKSPEYAKRICTNPRSEQSSSPNQLDPVKAQHAIDFIRSEITLGRPVLVSTNHYTLQGSTVKPVGFHMLLVLEVDNMATVHDPAFDCICRIPLREPLSAINGVVVGGLYDRLATSDYYCVSFDDA
jgi:hypothetical protein